MMVDVENTLKDNEFFANTVDAPKKGFEQHNETFSELLIKHMLTTSIMN